MWEIDRKLHDYLLDHTDSITDEWLGQREKDRGSIYSIDAGDEAETLLRQHNQYTNLTVISSLLGNKEVYEENKKNWAIIVAESRVNSNTPIHEVLEALGKVRKTFCAFIEKFTLSVKNQVELEDILRWNRTIHTTFDELYVQFAEMYYIIMNRRFTSQQHLIDELGTPVIKVNSTLGILPLIGDIDTTRAQSFMDYIPEKCTKLNIDHLYIDLSGVSIIDTMVAHQIYQITQILKLLGIHSTITGIRPEIAQTAIQLGLDFSSIHTYSSLDQALQQNKLIQ